MVPKNKLLQLKLFVTLCYISEIEKIRHILYFDYGITNKINNAANRIIFYNNGNNIFVNNK